MADRTVNSGRAAIISAIFCLPSITFYLLLMLNIEPPFAAMLRGEPDEPNIVGSLIALVLFLLLPAAFFISLRPVALNMRAGNGAAAVLVNLFLAVVSFCFFALIAGSIIIDQYPCWIGVPNCD